MYKLILLSFFLISFNSSFADECAPSKWGQGDEIGSANLISPESVLKAAKLIKYGKTYSLGLTIDANTPAYPPRSLSLQVVQPTQQFGTLGLPNSTYNDDIFQGWFGIGSQIDGLGHIGTTEAIFYNCHDGKEFAQITGLTKLGIEKIPPLVARGLVIDVASFGSKRDSGPHQWACEERFVTDVRGFSGRGDSFPEHKRHIPEVLIAPRYPPALGPV